MKIFALLPLATLAFASANKLDVAPKSIQYEVEFKGGEAPMIEHGHGPKFHWDDVKKIKHGFESHREKPYKAEVSSHIHRTVVVSSTVKAMNQTQAKTMIEEEKRMVDEFTGKKHHCMSYIPWSRG